MFFKKLFNRKKEETPAEMLRRLKPELFDESGNTYNGGRFDDSPEAKTPGENQLIIFPELTAVFASVTQFETNNLLPLCSFDLSLVNREWNFKGHFIYYNKTQSGNGEPDPVWRDYEDYYITLFKRVDDQIKHIGSRSDFVRTKDEEEYWLKSKQNYFDSIRKYKTDPVAFLNTKRINKERIVRQLGSTPKWVQSDETPKISGSEKLFFLGQLDKLSLIDDEGWIFLFYSPGMDLFIQVEQWT